MLYISMALERLVECLEEFSSIYGEGTSAQFLLNWQLSKLKAVASGSLRYRGINP